MAHDKTLKPSNPPPLEWVGWFNNRGLLEAIGNIPPADAEVNFYAALEISDMAAQLRHIGLRKSRRGSDTHVFIVLRDSFFQIFEIGCPSVFKHNPDIAQLPYLVHSMAHHKGA